MLRGAITHGVCSREAWRRRWRRGRAEARREGGKEKYRWCAQLCLIRLCTCITSSDARRHRGQAETSRAWAHSAHPSKFQFPMFACTVGRIITTFQECTSAHSAHSAWLCRVHMPWGTLRVQGRSPLVTTTSSPFLGLLLPSLPSLTRCQLVRRHLQLWPSGHPLPSFLAPVLSLFLSSERDSAPGAAAASEIESREAAHSVHCDGPGTLGVASCPSVSVFRVSDVPGFSGAPRGSGM